MMERHSDTMFFGSDRETILKAAKTIAEGGLVAFPTETVYGLGANALNPTASANIFKAKGRPADNPLIVHIADLADLEKYAYPTPVAYQLAKAFWPGPLTMILPKKEIIPDIVSAGLPTVAIRFPSNPIAQELIRLSGCPIAAPSANLSGSPSPTKAEHVRNDYEGTDRIDGIIDGGSCACGLESTVITLTTTPPVLLRPGFITPDDLREFIPDLVIADAVKNKIPEGTKVQSPGLLHRHYAPKAETEGVKGSSRRAAAYINASMLGTDRCGVMCFDGEEDLYLSKAEVLSYGKESDPAQRAAEMFDALRILDKKNLKKIFIRIHDGDGLDLAIFNRLIRACEFNITDPEKYPPVIGLTGLSGSGKTTIGLVLKEMGYDHIDTDGISRLTLDLGKEELVTAFGETILSSDQTVDRKKLAAVAFSSRENTDILNRITHRYIMAEVVRQLKKDQDEKKRALIDGAALLEAEADLLCDRLIVVYAPEEVRLKRILERDGITEEEAKKRFSRQIAFEKLSQKADFLFDNSSLFPESEIKRLTEFLSQI